MKDVAVAQSPEAPAEVPAEGARARTRARGQIIVIFAIAFMVFMGLSAIVIDVSWYWSSQVRMQRAADAAALAGVVKLPGDVTGAQTLARTEASRNGYTGGVNGFVVTPIQDPQSTRRIQVTISGPVGTFFARVIGMNSFPALVVSRAQYILPVPMGSPENYYGVFGLTRGLTTTSTQTVTTRPLSDTDSGATFDVPTTAPSPNPAWTSTSGGTLVAAVDSNNTTYAQTPTDLAAQVWGGFGLLSGLTGSQNVMQVYGIQVQLNDAHVSALGCTTSVFRVAVSFDAGNSWTTSNNVTGSLPTSTTTGDYSFGSQTNLNAWTGAGPASLTNNNFRVRITADKVGACGGATQLRLDHIAVKAWFQIETVTTTTSTVTTAIPDQNLQGPGTACAGAVPDCYVADGVALNPRGFWGTMNTQGAANINGDAHQPYYDNPTSTPAVDCSVAPVGTACYDPDEYYNYAVEMPAGSTNGKVYIYDPNFCAEAVNKGTGDRWFSGSEAVTSMFELWDTNNTLYDRGDDGIGGTGTTPNATSGNLFRNMRFSDTSMGGTAATGGIVDCRTQTNGPYGDGRDYHSNWYLLYDAMVGGATGPRIYRVHTTSTDPANPTQQQVANGANSFAIYASASGGTPKLYGLGAMQAFTPLKANGGTEQSEFYLAQIEKVHANKTVEISLWDPGDTDPLTASIEILIPTSTGWTATPVTYTASLGTSNSGRADGPAPQPDCRTLSRTPANNNPISTYTAGGGSTTGKFNGCWLVINAVIPGNYQGDQLGWWKIRYTMNGTGTSNDVTTWKVQILGNPVHLIVN